MKVIRFSHCYPKLQGQSKAKLIWIELIKLPDDMNIALLQYDTVYFSDGVKGYYTLAPGNYIQLVFLGNLGIPFCTIRPYSKHKYMYYAKSIDDDFEIIVEEK
ncbi:MAG: hypothetical protein LBL00_08770 [Endomicrobium sp.]|nr:hypothetical protein [Endomicrobium sp.]